MAPSHTRIGLFLVEDLYVAEVPSLECLWTSHLYQLRQ